MLDDATWNDVVVLAGEVEYDAPELTWRVDLEPGATEVLEYSVTVLPTDELGDGRLVNTVTGGITCPPDGDCRADTAVGAVTYAKTIIDPADGRATAGGEVTYRVTVTTAGGGALAGLRFTDDLAEVLTAASGPTSIEANLGEVTYAEPVLTWTGDLAPGQVATVTYTVVLDEDIEQDTLPRNVVIGDGLASNGPDGADADACVAEVTIDAPDPVTEIERLPFTGASLLWMLRIGLATLLLGLQLRRGPRQPSPRRPLGAPNA